MIEPNTYFAPYSAYMPPMQYIMPDARFKEKQHLVKVRTFMHMTKPDWGIKWDYSPWYAEKMEKNFPYMLALDIHWCMNGIVYCLVLTRALPLPEAKPWIYKFWMDQLEWRRVLYFCPELR
jgi:hypothetical protein